MKVYGWDLHCLFLLVDQIQSITKPCPGVLLFLSHQEVRDLLAFVPTEQVREYMQLLLRDKASRGDGLLASFADYFQRTYVGQEYLIGERFDRAIWNMYQRVKDQLPRTNNAVEGFHSAFAKDIKDHPPVTVLSGKYRKVQHHKANMRQQHLDGAKMPPVRRTYQRVTASIRRQVERFDRGLIQNLVYLEQVAKVMTIQTDP